MRRLVVLVALAMAAVLAFEALDVTDADARRRRTARPPSYDFVFCLANEGCGGSEGANLLVGASGNETLLGYGGNDIYVGSAGIYDNYYDYSTSSDLYGGFRNDEFDTEYIEDYGGLDRVDLSESYASTDFAFYRLDWDGDGAQDDLNIDEIISGTVHPDDIVVYNHFGSGRVEYIKFSDTTLSGANIPGLITQ